MRFEIILPARLANEERFVSSTKTISVVALTIVCSEVIDLTRYWSLIAHHFRVVGTRNEQLASFYLFAVMTESKFLMILN